jgi:GNAT superfamily N-acetyltransferase
MIQFQNQRLDARTNVDDGSLFRAGGLIVRAFGRRDGGHGMGWKGRMPTDRRRGEGCYRLEQPRCDQDWQAYHGIRRKVFHLPPPDEPISPHCHPLLLFLEDQPIGAIQVDDLRNAAAALRLVAIDPAWQGGGHGRAMLERAEQYVRELGCSKAVVYATPEAAGFYQTVGYDEEDWDEVCMGGIVQMLKKLE